MSKKTTPNTGNDNSSNDNKDSTTGKQNNSSIKLPTLYWVAFVSFVLLLIVGVAAAYVLLFNEFNNPVEIAICICAIICCAFICATLLLIFSFKYLYNLKKASNQKESTKILENAYIKYFQDKDTGNKTDTENSDANNETK